MSSIDDLPVYLYCTNSECTQKHFITVNRDITGKYTIGYVEFENHTCITDLAFNESDTFEQAVSRMKFAIERRAKRLTA